MGAGVIARAALVVLAGLACGRAAAGPCEAGARAAEQAFGLPDGLLAAIGRIESGRPETGGGFAAWPWAVNAAGQGYFPQSAAEASALVAGLRARGVQSIDVGCFQVNLLHHPDAFATLADAFDPMANALAAGRFLGQLRALSGEWEEAVGRYHSANPTLGQPYRQQVLASWRGGVAGFAAPVVSRVMALVRVVVPTGAQSNVPTGAQSNVPLGARSNMPTGARGSVPADVQVGMARGVPVGAPGRARAAVTPAALAWARLPVVIVPSRLFR